MSERDVVYIPYTVEEFNASGSGSNTNARGVSEQTCHLSAETPMVPAVTSEEVRETYLYRVLSEMAPYTRDKPMPEEIVPDDPAFADSLQGVGLADSKATDNRDMPGLIRYDYWLTNAGRIILAALQQAGGGAEVTP